MRTGISISVTASDRSRLEAIVSARSSPQKHVWWARIILLTDQWFRANAIMAATAKSKTCIWRWHEATHWTVRAMAKAVGILDGGPEALNSKLRRTVRTRGHFPGDEAAMKPLYLVLNHAAAEWKRPPREWFEAKTQFAILFGDRFQV